MNDAVIMKAVPSPSPDDTSTAWQGIPFSANTSRPGGLNKPQVMVLIAASVLIHGVIWWYMQTAQPDVPEVAPQVPEMTIELTSPTPPAPEPPPPEPPPPPPPPPPPRTGTTGRGPGRGRTAAQTGGKTQGREAQAGQEGRAGEKADAACAQACRCAQPARAANTSARAAGTCCATGSGQGKRCGIRTRQPGQSTAGIPGAGVATQLGRPRDSAHQGAAQRPRRGCRGDQIQRQTGTGRSGRGGCAQLEVHTGQTR